MPIVILNIPSLNHTTDIKYIYIIFINLINNYMYINNDNIC